MFSFIESCLSLIVGRSLSSFDRLRMRTFALFPSPRPELVEGRASNRDSALYWRAILSRIGGRGAGRREGPLPARAGMLKADPGLRSKRWTQRDLRMKRAAPGDFANPKSTLRTSDGCGRILGDSTTVSTPGSDPGNLGSNPSPPATCQETRKSATSFSQCVAMCGGREWWFLGLIRPAGSTSYGPEVLCLSCKVIDPIRLVHGGKE